MHSENRLPDSLSERRVRRSGAWGFALVAALGCSAAMAGTGHVPTDQDTYPEPIAAIPAVLGQCFACHGPNGRSEYLDWPSLAGQKQSYLLQQLRDFKSGARKHPMMQPVVAVLSDDDLKTAADYLSKRPPPQPQPQPAGNKAVTTGKPPVAAVACIACHDNAALPTEPYLNAQQVDYLVAQIHAFKAGVRNNEVMQALVANLSDEEIYDIAAYFSAQTHISSTEK